MSDRYIEPYEIERRIRAAYVVGAINYTQFEAMIDKAVRGLYKYAPLDVPYGSELRDRLLVDV